MPTEHAPAEAGLAALASGVHHTFPEGMKALEGAEVGLRLGALTALVGANGAGKSTLLRILAGILAPSEGRVWILGCEQPGRAPARVARSLRARVGYVPQSPAFDPEMTGRETLELCAALQGVPRAERRLRVEALAEMSGTAEHLDRRLDTYSGGLKRRLHVAAGMIHDPELLLLDEPGAGMDARGDSFLWAELRRRAQRGRAVAIITHDLAATEREAHRVVILERGKVIAEGAPGELVARHGRTRVQVTVERSSEARQALERLAGELGATLEAPEGSERWSLALGGGEGPGRLLAELARVGHLLREVEVRAPSLASALMALTGRPEASHAGGRGGERPRARRRG